MPRAKTTTIAGQTALADSLSAKIEPTSPLSDREQTIFDYIIFSRESATWMPHDRLMATQLAKFTRRMEEIGELLDAGGYTQINIRGTEVTSPLLAASMQIAGTVQSLTRILGLSADKRGVSGENQSRRNEAELKARGVIGKAKQDPLLA
jgi:hypothetical protein